MALKSKILGIDIGSVSAGVAVLDDSYRILYTSYKFHKGQIVDSLRSMLSVVDPEELMAIAYTSSSPEVFHQGKKIDNRVAFISAARHFSPDLQALLIIGAEKFGLATFNEKGEYLNYRSNSSCAAGTGNFLDQQAERLNLKNIREFSRLASGNTGNFPKIASRCAVFAKTDLIHVQQEGYSLGEICDGLSYGLAKNIVDTVFQGVTTRNIIAAGGVALNKAVIRHIEKLTEKSITVDEHAPLYGAIGAALDLITNREEEALELRKFEDFIYTGKKVKKYQYPPLKLKLSSYPDFDAHEYYIFHPACLSSMKDVEVDAYTDLTKDCSIKAYLGIDIGSTSTKAILIDHSKNVIAGFYTRTSGQPLQAVQVLFEAICDFEQRKNVRFVIVGAGTTGSGRKFTGQIIGADSIIDEITAHARAACELNPDTDTIIEIGGQDSKFTILNQGMVTFSVMNNVCAAGTGSFIEEQAKRLNCPLQDYSRRVEEVHSPMASDRCTVFMERDLNHYLMSGYSADEILAAVLHATRENYLTKVAVRGYIGKTIFFQGATAKNKALVAAFEQALEKPIMVSRYCHLTGALGVALELHDNKLQSTRFKGLDLYRKTIPVRSEVCELCTNHCKLKVAEVDGRTEAYGFLCGRDYDADRYVKSDSGAFQLLRQRDTIFRFRPKTTHARLTLGIPAGLHLFEEVPFWREFFDLLSIRTVTSEDYHDAVRNGKKLAGAEFCAPIAAMHGHVDYLKDRVDYIFLPVYLEETQESKMNKQYCYYTQFVSSVIATQTDSDLRKKLLSPLLKSNHSELFIRIELFRMLRKIGLGDIGLLAVSHAWEQAMKKFNRQKELWHSLYPKEIHDRKDLHIMLLGRPYTVLSTAMNSSIPDIISKTGISTFFMDMLPYRPKEISRAEELVKTIKWKFASKILYAAEVVAKTDNCYPVLVTSFKCTPDSFVIEYFKEIMNAYEKPYLILQLDEHDSTVGYETRIEAGIRAFRNHRSRQLAGKGRYKTNESALAKQVPAGPAWHDSLRSLVNEAAGILKTHAIDFRLFSRIIQQVEEQNSHDSRSILSGIKSLKDKTLLIPDWDPYVGPLLVAVLKHSGINAMLVPAAEESVRRSLSLNTGQCLPLNIIVQNAIDFVESTGLDPADTALWIMKANLSCNISMFPYYMKRLLNNYGKGMEKASVYVGDIIFYDFSLSTAINAYLAYMFGGYIRRIGCRIRPYEKVPGTTDLLIGESLKQLEQSFLKGESRETLLRKIISDFDAIKTEKRERHKVAIFGDLYVRDNDIMNQDLIKMVEANGGEVITTPYSEYIKIIADPIRERSLRQGQYLNYMKIKFLTSLIPLVEDKYRECFRQYNGVSMKISPRETDAWLQEFGMSILHKGESLENILKIHRLIRGHPDLDLFIQTNPSYCCPSLVTEAMTAKIEELTGVPVVTIEYDGTAGLKNEDLIPYLKYRKKKAGMVY